MRALTAAGAAAPATATRVTNAAGAESHPTWAPDSARVAYQAARPGAGSAVWVSDVAASGAAASGAGGGGGGRAGRGRAAGGPGGFGGGAAAPAVPTAVLASRHGGIPAWSSDGEWLAIATFPVVNAQYNGNPLRNDDDVAMAASDASAYQFWRVLAPRAVDQGATSASLPAPDAARWTTGFDQTWQTLKTMYYTTGPSAAAWDALREKYRPQAARATDAASFEAVIDAMVAEQPLIKQGAESNRAVVTSASPFASAAGAEVIAKGGNVVDAGIAVAIALGVVEPDATSLGGDGQAILFLKGMTEPVVVEYKDMSPSHATSDNAKLFTPTGGRTANDGPTVANIPGVAAGWDLLYQKYGSKKVAWADIVSPAIKLADEGFILDEALPTTIAEGRAQFAKYPESAKMFLPGGKVPKPGDRFVNKDYAETLRILAKEGARSVYTGTIAQRIAADMAANGGVIDAEDLAQYRAMERKPLMGHYRGNLVYSVPAPVSSGAQLVETLNILDNYKPKPGATYTTDAEYFHYAIDAWRVRDGGGRIADPERWPVDYGDHLEAAHALERFKLLDPKKAYAAAGGGRGGGCAGAAGLQAGGISVACRRRVRPDSDRDDVVRRRRRRRQHDRLHADALDLGRQLLRVEGSGLSLQRSLPRRRRARRRIRIARAADAIEFDERADAGLRAREREHHEQRHSGLHVAARDRLRGQRVDPRFGLRHHPQRRRRRHAGAARDRSAALPHRRDRRADRRSVPALNPQRAGGDGPQLPEDRPQGRSEVRLRVAGGRAARERHRRSRRRTPPVARRRRGQMISGETDIGWIFTRYLFTRYLLDRGDRRQRALVI